MDGESGKSTEREREDVVGAEKREVRDIEMEWG